MTEARLKRRLRYHLKKLGFLNNGDGDIAPPGTTKDENRLAASTVHSYSYYWEHLLKPRSLKFMLRDFFTPDGQKLLDEIARQNPEMKKDTLHKLKSILSAIFRLAIAQGYRPGPNPIRETALPRAPEGDDTFAYDLETILAMLRLVRNHPARCSRSQASLDCDVAKSRAYLGSPTMVRR